MIFNSMIFILLMNHAIVNVNLQIFYLGAAIYVDLLLCRILERKDSWKLLFVNVICVCVIVII